MADLHAALAAVDAAIRTSDWPEALRIAEGLRAEFPDHPVPILRTGAALIHMQRFDEAEALLEAEQSRFPAEINFALGLAWSAHYRGDIPKALSAWQDAQDKFPDNWLPAFGKATTLSVAERLDDAATLLEESVARWPDIPELPIAYGRLAQTRSDLSGAVLQWERVRTRFPDRGEGYWEAVQTLRVLRRVADAESVLDAAVARFGENAGVATERVRLALLNNPPDRDALLRHAVHLREHYPDHEAGYEAAVDALREVGRAGEAEDLAASGVQRFPGNFALGVRYVEMARARNDIPAIVLRASALRERFPRQPFPHFRLIHALAAAGRLDEAERAGVEGAKAAPGDFDVALARAYILVHRQEWKAALSAFVTMRERFPNDQRLERQIFESRLRVAEFDPQAAELMGAHAPSDGATTREILMQFESLGAREGGCEFGIVQRTFGAEPLGLLRWTEIGPGQLTAALESDFAGVGEPDQTELVETPNVGGGAEYQTRDGRFGMRMHTFVNTDKIAPQQMLAQSCRRLQFLRRKLLDDLAAGAKVFVYKMSARTLTPEELARLHAALRRHGPATLLYVRYEDAAHPNGTVEMVAPGLMIGYIDRFNVTPEGKVVSEAFDSWEAICRGAHALWTEQRALSESPVSDTDIALAAPAIPAPPNPQAAPRRPGVTEVIWRYLRAIRGLYSSRLAP